MPYPVWNLSHQCPVYVAYRPDPEALAINSFTLSWSGIQFYAFPPFCIISSILQKTTKDKAQGVVVVPYWPNQPWFPRLASMLTSEPVLLSAREDMLQLPVDLMAKHHLRKHCAFLFAKSQESSQKLRLFETGCLNFVFILESRHQEPVCNIHQQMESLCFQKTH